MFINYINEWGKRCAREITALSEEHQLADGICSFSVTFVDGQTQMFEATEDALASIFIDIDCSESVINFVDRAKILRRNGSAYM